MRALRILPALLLLGAAEPPRRYSLEPAASTVSARVAFFGLTLDPDTRELGDLSVVIDATALTAPDPVTLARLKGPQFFDVARFPTVRFTGRRLRMTGDREASVDGEITARGVTRPATLQVRFAAPPRLAGPGARLSIDASTTIDRRDFGMTAYPLIVGRQVAIRIKASFAPG
jgi:polyisoprenoid-binding protein YceI